MAFGPGSYDDLCTHVRLQAKAEGAIVIVLNGEKGNGFSVQGDWQINAALPGILRQVAEQIEKDMRRG